MMMRYEYDDIVKVVSHKRVIKNMTMKYEDDDDYDGNDDYDNKDDLSTNVNENMKHSIV